MSFKMRIVVLAGRHKCVSCDMEDKGSSGDSLPKAFLPLDADERLEQERELDAYTSDAESGHFAFAWWGSPCELGQ